MQDAPIKLIEAANLVLPNVLELKESIKTPIMLIDGRAGSGKSTLAALLANLVFEADKQSPRVVHMDDLYPGWQGLQAGSLYLTEQVLRPLKQKGFAEWQRWDWIKSERGGSDPGNGWRSFEGSNLLIVEGCGSLTASNKPLADLAIWVESELETRKERFLSRDQGRFAYHWTTWTVQEDDFYADNESKELADLVVEN